MTVTQITPTVEHFDPCTEQAIGRRVLAMLATNPGRIASLDEVVAGARRRRPRCSCFRIQLANVEADLQVHMRRGADKVREIALLEARRNALRAAMSG